MEDSNRHSMNERDFEELFHQHFDNLMGFACSYVRDEEVARDIVHDAFTTLWSHRAHLDASRPLASYLYTLARNYSLDWIRHRRVEMAHEESVARFWEENAREEVKDEGEKIVRLREKMKELPEKQREVLTLCFMQGKSYQEVADGLGVSVNTVKTHIKRGLKFLRDELQDDALLLLLAFPRHRVMP